MKKIIYNGDIKVIKRLCEVVNELVDGGGGGGSESPLYYDTEGHLCIDYDLVRQEDSGT